LTVTIEEIDEASAILDRAFARAFS